MNAYYIEVTDTYGGESNYSWVQKFYIEATEATVVRRAKKEIRWNGVRCDRNDCGETIKLIPRGLAQVAFIERGETIDFF